MRSVGRRKSPVVRNVGPARGPNSGKVEYWSVDGPFSHHPAPHGPRRWTDLFGSVTTSQFSVVAVVQPIIPSFLLIWKGDTIYICGLWGCFGWSSIWDSGQGTVWKGFVFFSVDGKTLHSQLTWAMDGPLPGLVCQDIISETKSQRGLVAIVGWDYRVMVSKSHINHTHKKKNQYFFLNYSRKYDIDPKHHFDPSSMHINVHSKFLTQLVNKIDYWIGLM